jgi:hypothetical protein
MTLSVKTSRRSFIATLVALPVVSALANRFDTTFRPPTYDATPNSLDDVVYNISPMDNPLINLKRHEWQQDELVRSGPVTEKAEYTQVNLPLEIEPDELLR